MKHSKSQLFINLVVSILFSQQAFAGRPILRCKSAEMGRDVAVVGTESYINKKTGKSETITVISAWIDQLENNYMFTNVRYNAKKGKYLAKRNIYNSLARVTIQSNTDMVEITFNGTKKTITDAKCSPVKEE